MLTNERLWAERLSPPPKSVPGGDVYGRIPPKEPSNSITCPSCNRSVGAARYAPHLDKCALGSSRGRASRSARSSVRGPVGETKGVGRPWVLNAKPRVLCCLLLCEIWLVGQASGWFH